MQAAGSRQHCHLEDTLTAKERIIDLQLSQLNVMTAGTHCCYSGTVNAGL